MSNPTEIVKCVECLEEWPEKIFTNEQTGEVRCEDCFNEKFPESRLLQ